MKYERYYEARQHNDGSHWFIDFVDEKTEGFTVRDNLSEVQAREIEHLLNVWLKDFMEKANRLFKQR